MYKKTPTRSDRKRHYHHTVATITTTTTTTTTTFTPTTTLAPTTDAPVADDGDVWCKCLNHSVCHASGSKWAFVLHRGLCPACYMCLGHLRFFTPPDNIASSGGDVCPICLEQGGERVQMTCDGNHNMCTACFRRPLTFVGYPTVFDFGCPRFRLGTPGQLDIIVMWSKRCPAKYTEFFKSLLAFGTDRDKRAAAQKELLARCPVCRGSSPWNGRNTECALMGETI